jgi:hypothetical protein
MANDGGCDTAVAGAWNFHTYAGGDGMAVVIQ